MEIKERLKTPYPIVVIDGVFFQFNRTGIARVWQNLLEEWVKSDFAQYLFFLDRVQTAPRIPNIQYLEIEAYDYRISALDCQKLQSICDRVKADLFISTYYTTPLSTPSILMVHDMIPEVISLDLSEPCWQEKHYSILYACRYIAVSENTAQDLRKFYPHIPQAAITVAHNGVSPDFFPTQKEDIERFRVKYDIKRPYFLLVGSRLSLKKYKNATLFFKALSQLSRRQTISVVCVGGEPELEPDLTAIAADTPIHLLRLEDEELRIAYTAALALIYPSLYEGFGLPIIEAMACGCPVITCRNSALAEVAGAAALYVGEDRIEEMLQALERVQVPEIRQTLIAAGLERAKQFSWTRMAATITQVVMETAEQVKDQRVSQASLLWQAFRNEQAQKQQLESFANAVTRLEEQNAELQGSIARLEKKIESLSTFRAALRQLLKATLLKLRTYWKR